MEQSLLVIILNLNKNKRRLKPFVSIFANEVFRETVVSFLVDLMTLNWKEEAASSFIHI